MGIGIPSLGFAIRQALDRLQWQHDIYNEEFVQRLQLVFGHPDYYESSSYGIVSDTNPTTATSGSALPLVVSANSDNTLNVDVVPGLAVTYSGQWVLLEEAARNIALANTATNIPNVVYIEYLLVDGPIELNDEIKPIVTFTQRPEDDSDVEAGFVIGTDTVDNYTSVAQDTLSRRVALCVVTVTDIEDPNTGTTTSGLSFDHTQNSYAWNRPWFSAVDIEHRSQLGTGTQSINNPHAISYNEASVGDFGPIELLTDHGIIISKAQSADKVPGYLCEEAVPSSQALTDDLLGTFTGYPFSPYIELGHHPARVGRVRLKSTDDDFPALWVKETNRIVFPSYGPGSGDTILVNYTRVEACEPPLKGLTSYTTNQPKSGQELIVSGGKGLTTLSSTEETFSDAHQFPMRYVMFVDKEGSLLKAPQVVYCFNRLENIATSDTPDITQYGNAILMMGLTGAGSDTAMIIKIRVSGLDENGNDVNYLFEFDGTTWVEPGPVGTCEVTNAGFQVSKGQLFSEITDIAIEERSDDTPSSAIMIWALINPRDTKDQMEQSVVNAEVMWDGVMLCDVRDKRIIGTTARDFLLTSDAKMAMQAHVRALGGNTTTVYVDDMRAPQYGNLLLPREVDEDSIESYYSWVNSDQMYVGRQGAFRTMALPMLPGSGNTFRVMMLPGGNELRSYTPPTVRYFLNSGVWTTFATMDVVPGVPHTYEKQNLFGFDAEGIQVQFPYDKYYRNQIVAIFGTGKP